MQWSAIQCSTVQCSAVLCIEVTFVPRLRSQLRALGWKEKIGIMFQGPTSLQAKYTITQPTSQIYIYIDSAVFSVYCMKMLLLQMGKPRWWQTLTEQCAKSTPLLNPFFCNPLTYQSVILSYFKHFIIHLVCTILNIVDVLLKQELCSNHYSANKW